MVGIGLDVDHWTTRLTEETFVGGVPVRGLSTCEVR